MKSSQNSKAETTPTTKDRRDPPTRARSGKFAVGSHHEFEETEQRLLDAVLDDMCKDIRAHYDKERRWRESPGTSRSHHTSVFWIAADGMVDAVSSIRVPFNRASWNAELSRIANMEAMGMDKTSQWQD